MHLLSHLNSGVLFGELSPFVNLALGGLVCIPSLIYLKYNNTSTRPK